MSPASSDRAVLIVRTGTANTASVIAGLRRAGAEAEISEDPRRIEEAERLILPGVGAFSAAMDSLRARGLIEPLRARLQAGKPSLCICLGLQLLAKASEESPGVEGLGIIGAEIRRFGTEVKVPQLGWNSVRPEPDCRFLRPGEAYFANSYRLVDAPEGWCVATTEHGGRFVSAMERGAVLACQFHPELSGAWGGALIKRWLEGVSC